MIALATLSAGRRLFHLPERFELEHGGALEHALLGYELAGDPALPLVCVHGGISADAHAAASAQDARPGWWQEFIGPGRALDTRRYRWLATDWLGGRGASSGPQALGEEPGAFPAVCARDQARALALLLAELGLRAHACVGASYGGTVALALAEQAPALVERVVAISAPHRSEVRASAARALQRRLLRWGARHGNRAEAAALARAFAMLGYRAAEELEQRFAAAPRLVDGRARLAIEDYLDARGAAWAADFPAAAYFALSEALDLSRVEPEAIRCACTLIGANSDALVPPALLRELRARLGGPAELELIDSRFGHDAFLKEPERLGALVAAALDRQVWS